jgi:hypothetical protein
MKERMIKNTYEERENKQFLYPAKLIAINTILVDVFDTSIIPKNYTPSREKRL